jgi:predicted  nucleic acid-binding Zn-ribbon protein
MNGFTPDQIGAIVGGFLVMMGALVAIITKAWQALADIRGEVKHDHGSSMKDASARTEEKVDSLGAAMHSVETAVGGLRDELRIIRRDGAQTREEVAHVRDSAEDTHRDLREGQERLSERIDRLGLDRP